MRRAAVAMLGTVAALAAAAAACRDQPDSSCLESGATMYGFELPGDTGEVFRWTAGHLPLRVYAEPVGALPTAVQGGAELWTRAMHCGELSFNMIADSNAADIVVRNPAALPAARLIAVAAAADSVGACSGRTDIDTLNRRVVRPVRVFVTANGTVSDSAAVAGCYRFTVAHELGHAIGLARHSPNPDDLMYPAPYRRLTTINDRYTVQILYRTTPTLPPAP